MSDDNQHFDLDDDFLDQEESGGDFERLPSDRNRKGTPVKNGKAAWSKLEDRLAERQLEKELQDFYVDDKNK
jgi:hypothetical protein